MQEINRYIEQLVEDIQSLYIDTSNIYSSYSIQTDTLQLNLVEQKLSSLVGLEKELLPAADNLNELQAKRLVTHIIFLLKGYNIIPDFPVGLPYIIRYSLILEFWDTDIKLIGKEHHIDLCHYDPDNCPYGDYCSICDDLDDT